MSAKQKVLTDLLIQFYTNLREDTIKLRLRELNLSDDITKKQEGENVELSSKSILLTRLLNAKGLIKPDEIITKDEATLRYQQSLAEADLPAVSYWTARLRVRAQSVPVKPSGPSRESLNNYPESLLISLCKRLRIPDDGDCEALRGRVLTYYETKGPPDWDLSDPNEHPYTAAHPSWQTGTTAETRTDSSVDTRGKSQSKKKTSGRTKKPETGLVDIGRDDPELRQIKYEDQINYTSPTAKPAEIVGSHIIRVVNYGDEMMFTYRKPDGTRLRFCVSLQFNQIWKTYNSLRSIRGTQIIGTDSLMDRLNEVIWKWVPPEEAEKKLARPGLKILKMELGIKTAKYQEFTVLGLQLDGMSEMGFLWAEDTEEYASQGTDEIYGPDQVMRFDDIGIYEQPPHDDGDISPAVQPVATPQQEYIAAAPKQRHKKGTSRRPKVKFPVRAKLSDEREAAKSELLARLPMHQMTDEEVAKQDKWFVRSFETPSAHRRRRPAAVAQPERKRQEDLLKEEKSDLRARLKRSSWIESPHKMK